MIEFAQYAAPWIGSVALLLFAVIGLASFALVAFGLVWRLLKNVIGLTIIAQALCEWHKAHPEASRKWRRWFGGDE